CLRSCSRWRTAGTASPCRSPMKYVAISRSWSLVRAFRERSDSLKRRVTASRSLFTTHRPVRQKPMTTSRANSNSGWVSANRSRSRGLPDGEDRAWPRPRRASRKPARERGPRGSYDERDSARPDRAEPPAAAHTLRFRRNRRAHRVDPPAWRLATYSGIAEGRELRARRRTPPRRRRARGGKDHDPRRRQGGR